MSYLVQVTLGIFYPFNTSVLVCFIEYIFPKYIITVFLNELELEMNHVQILK